MSPFVANVWAQDKNNPGAGWQNVASNTHFSALPGLMQQYAGGVGNGFGAGGAGLSTFQPAGGGSLANGGGNPNIQSLLAQQKSENDWAKNQNIANWNQGRDLLLNSQSGYNNSPITGANRNLTQQLLANPEAINDRVQSLIQNKAANTLDAQTAGRMRQGMGALAAGGQLDAGSIAAMQERLGRANMAQRTNVQSQLEVQRANQRNQDIMNALNQGRQQAGQDYGVNAGTAQTFLENMPQYRPDNLSGYIAALGANNGGGSGGYGGVMPGVGLGGPGGGGWSGWSSPMGGGANRGSGASTFIGSGGFGWSTPEAAKGGGYTYQPAGADPLGNGRLGTAGTGYGTWSGGFHQAATAPASSPAASDFTDWIQMPESADPGNPMNLSKMRRW